MLKGAIHIHSTYSDGEFSLRQLRQIFLHTGCSFALVTDHAEAFDSESLNHYVTDCESLSDEQFLFIPGLEYECEQRMHILSYGSTPLFETRAPEEVIRKIEEHGGVSVIAHPKNTMFGQIASFSTLPQGIEVWNTKYDGQYAPRPATFRLLARLQQRQPTLLAFYGLDLHWKRQYRGMFNWLRIGTLKRDDILDAFRRGLYYGVKDQLELPSNGVLPEESLTRFEMVHRRSARLRNFIKEMKKTADSLGLKVPDSVKAQLRRIL